MLYTCSLFDLLSYAFSRKMVWTVGSVAEKHSIYSIGNNLLHMTLYTVNNFKNNTVLRSFR